MSTWGWPLPDGTHARACGHCGLPVIPPATAHDHAPLTSDAQED